MNRYDDAAEDIHRAFCDPDHEQVGEWDREMADALRRRGLAIVKVEPVPRTAIRAWLIEQSQLATAHIHDRDSRWHHGYRHAIDATLTWLGEQDDAPEPDGLDVERVDGDGR